MYLGQNSISQEGLAVAYTDDGVIRLSDAVSMSRVPEDSILPIGPDCPPPPCPPPFDCSQCPVKIVEKKVSVPGPVQIVYVDRYITQPGGTTPGGAPSTVDPTQVIPVPTLPPQEDEAQFVLSEISEDFEMAEGGLEPHVVGKRIPWWMVALGVGGVAFYMMQKK